MFQAVASIATPETDAALAAREQSLGAQARMRGEPRESCPWQSGMTRLWWLMGWDGALALAKAFPLGGPLLGGGA
jgi:ribosome modulation factor